ncbi:phosphatidylinositol-4- kinase, partial [Entophlyctis luteolus]
VSNEIIKNLNSRAVYLGEVQGIIKMMSKLKPAAPPSAVSEILKAEISSIDATGSPFEFVNELSPALHRCAAFIVSQKNFDMDLLHLLCWTPFAVFDISCIETAIPLWDYILSARPELNSIILHKFVAVWESTVSNGQGLYQRCEGSADPFMNKMTYTPSKKPVPPNEAHSVHRRWIQFLSDRFRQILWHKKEHVKIYFKLLQVAIPHLAFTRPTASLRSTVYSLLRLTVSVVNELEHQRDPEWLFSLELLFRLIFKWFRQPAMWNTFQPDELKSIEFARNSFKALNIEKANTLFATLPDRVFAHFRPFKRDFSAVKNFVILLLENEIARFSLWTSDGTPLAGAAVFFETLDSVVWKDAVRIAWNVDPLVALNLPSRFIGHSGAIQDELDLFIWQFPLSAVGYAKGVESLLRYNFDASSGSMRRFLFYWAEVSPITAISYLNPKFNHPWILQYAFRVLEYHPVDQVFFYIPQMVQALRHDVSGYVEHFILKTARISQLFAHQIIWNMKANMFIVVKEKKHEEVLVPDPLKPTLDKIIDKITSSLSGADREFYEREFRFFANVTGISGKLKPYIQKSKQEKKKKIDEEMRLIDLEVGVYLPSNPESIVVDIDLDSGRPLQSHAK